MDAIAGVAAGVSGTLAPVTSEIAADATFAGSGNSTLESAQTLQSPQTVERTDEELLADDDTAGLQFHFTLECCLRELRQPPGEPTSAAPATGGERIA